MTLLKCTAAGDMLIQRRLPGAYEGFEQIRDYIMKGDFRFFNLETTLHNYECYGSQYNGGSYLAMDPRVLEDAKAFGFNVLSPNNNHSMDYSYSGLEKTLDNINKFGFIATGTGRNLAEAAAPVYLDTLSGRYALISACSTFNPAAMAGEQTANMPGRPGVNGIRFDEIFGVTNEQLESLCQIAKKTAINGRTDIMRAEGYLPVIPNGMIKFGNHLFKVAKTLGRETHVNEVDMKRVERSIYEAQLQADYIIVSIHSHEVKCIDKEEPAQFVEEFAHKCIDAGAHAVVGHGPHLLRPIEIYKGCPIFYSLGDFVLQNENIQKAPHDMYQDYGVAIDATIHDLFKTRSRNFTRGIQTDHRMFESVIPYWEVEDGVMTKLTLLPIELCFGMPRSRNGWPRPLTTAGIIERLAAMSEKYGTKISIKDGIGTVKL